MNHRVETQEGLVNRLPLLEEPSPPLPEPASVEPKREEKAAAQTAGEKYGTQVLFLNNPIVASEKAQGEKKLLFVMHISGNFEDSCFT